MKILKFQILILFFPLAVFASERLNGDRLESFFPAPSGPATLRWNQNPNSMQGILTEALSELVARSPRVLGPHSPLQVKAGVFMLNDEQGANQIACQLQNPSQKKGQSPAPFVTEQVSLDLSFPFAVATYKCHFAASHLYVDSINTAPNYKWSDLVYLALARYQENHPNLSNLTLITTTSGSKLVRLVDPTSASRIACESFDPNFLKTRCVSDVMP